jgi:small subunit ribosomal protein S6
LTDYELATIVDPDLDEEQVSGAISMVEQLIGEQGGSLISVDRWEKRRLTYPIKKKYEGSHVFFRFSADPSSLTEIKRRLGIAESIMRHMIVLLEPWEDVPAAVRGVPRSAAVQAPAPAEEEPPEEGGAEEEAAPPSGELTEETPAEPAEGGAEEPTTPLGVEEAAEPSGASAEQAPLGGTEPGLLDEGEVQPAGETPGVNETGQETSDDIPQGLPEQQP